jgi:ABC-2 type transport system permease protein
VQYAILSTIVKVSFGRNESLLTSKIKSGDIAYDLLKPYDLFLYYAADSIGVSLFQIFARSIPLLILSFSLLGKFPSLELVTFIKFLLIYFISFGIYLCFGYYSGL